MNTPQSKNDCRNSHSVPGVAGRGASHTLVESLEERRLLSAAPSLSVGDLMITEGHTGLRHALVVVRLSRAATKPVTVNFRTADGTAVAGADYQSVSGKLTFAAGQTVRTIAVPIDGDCLGETDERFTVRLSGAKNATIGDGTGLVNILDDEPRVTIDDVLQVEGDAGESLFAFTVRLSAASDLAVTVDYTTADGTATTADSDYAASAGTLTFAPGETTKTILIAVPGDTTSEPHEAFFLNLGGTTNAFLADPQALGRILTDDPWTIEPDPQEPCMVNCGVDGDGGWSGVAP